MSKSLILLIFITLTITASIVVSCSDTSTNEKYRSAISIPLKGNSWVTDTIREDSKMISDSGLTGWTSMRTAIQTYFRLEKPGTISIAVRARVISGK